MSKYSCGSADIYHEEWHIHYEDGWVSIRSIADRGVVLNIPIASWRILVNACNSYLPYHEGE